jgi:methyltransferase (TIGR00027 family)
MMSPVGLTSRWVAASRALETAAPNPLFADPLAHVLAGEEGYALLRASRQASTMAQANGADPYLAIRTRFFDDALLGAVGEGGPSQVVLVAAGMDARAFRLAWPDGLTLFEIDRDEVFDYKEPLLAGLGAQPRCARHVVRADLGRDWVGPLTRAGFDPDRPAVFLVEGLLVYLEAADVDALLAALGQLARPGSWLGADLAGTEFLSSPFVQPLLKMLEQLGCPWRFGTADPMQLLARHGWAADVVVVGEPRANYGRWPYPVAPRGVPGVPRSYFVTARRAG